MTVTLKVFDDVEAAVNDIILLLHLMSEFLLSFVADSDSDPDPEPVDADVFLPARDEFFLFHTSAICSFIHGIIK